MDKYDPFDWINKTYSINAKKDMHVKVIGLRGVITGANGNYIDVKIEGKKHPLPFHPTDIEFYKE